MTLSIFHGKPIFLYIFLLIENVLHKTNQRGYFQMRQISKCIIIIHIKTNFNNTIYMELGFFFFEIKSICFFKKITNIFIPKLHFYVDFADKRHLL